MSILDAVRTILMRDERPATRPARGFADAARHSGSIHRRPSRFETVETENIVGSVGRAHELRGDFRPPRAHRRKADNERFDSILRAMERGRTLPPVQLYRVGDEYYVLDGHHRVAAALRVGQLAMDAHVVEFLPSIGAAA